MDGTGPEIEIFKPFGEAFELTKKILFQPFELKKWCVMGFAAFLAGRFAGSGFGFPFGNLNSRHQNQNFNSQIPEEWKPWLPILIGIFALLILVVIVLFTWLKSRGDFIFTDCIVRNRGAIVEPWIEYRKEGNSNFLFRLVVMFASMAVFGLAALIIFVPLGLFGQGVSSDAMTPLIILCFVLLFLAWICFAIFFGITSYFMVPVMYIRRCRALGAFREVVSVVLNHIAPFILFCLFSICLLLGVVMVSGIVTCATCCLATLPYVGTVILLPVFVCLRSFGLLFFRQFGPNYDVWASVPVVPPPPPTPPPVPS